MDKLLDDLILAAEDQASQDPDAPVTWGALLDLLNRVQRWRMADR